MDNVVSLRGRPAQDVSSGLVEFATRWFPQVAIGWRASTRTRVATILDRHVLPAFAGHPVDGFDRADLMAWRAQLATGAVGRPPCSASRINAIVQVVRQCLAERQRQLGFLNPCDGLPRLPARRPRIAPFSLPELRRLVDAAPSHLKDYLLVRGLVGLRSGEANGLRWDCVDLAAGTIEVACSRADGVDGLPKNESSERVVAMTPTVRDAMRRQWMRTGEMGGYVFLTRRSQPLDTQNFARRDWRRLLRKAGLAHRAPEQLRHTAATLMLAAGEAPTFVAQVLGHADCRMLLTVYARFMPGALGRQDGAALEAVLAAA